MTTVAEIAIDQNNPWPGLGSFDEGAARYFNGRQNETAELRRLLLDAPLTVLFGASGLGKTSLVQAGLFPLLRKQHYLPVYVRLDLRNQTAPLIEQVKYALQSQIHAKSVDAPAISEGESLWVYLHRPELELWSKQNQLLTPVFVFDQFEEVFTLGAENPAAIARLRIDLADLVENRLPAALAENAENGHDLSLDSQRYKVVLSFREDFLPAVEGWRREMPSILRSRLRLLPMSAEQAFEAVYNTAPHLVDAELAKKIVTFVAAARHDGRATETVGITGELVVEPALLSLVCRGLNEKRKAQGKSAFDQALLAGSGEAIISDYYAKSVDDLPVRVQRFIENELITERGFRKPCDVDDARTVHGVTDQELRLLVDRRVLRIEAQRGTERVELTHDLLTRVVREHRDLQRERARIRRQRRQFRNIAIIAVIVAAIGVAWLKQDALLDRYFWYRDMRAPLLSVGDKHLAPQPGSPITPFADCRQGCPQMIVIPAGKFMMGSAAEPDIACDALRPCESPQHEVTIDHPFAVSQTEVTFDQWNMCVKDGDCLEANDFTWGGGDRPVIGVGWPAAVSYTKWLSRLSGQNYRLLTESEWEYAARAASNDPYSFGNNESELDHYAWFKDNSGNKTHPVGQKQANPFGLLDMYGNVGEWVEDTFHADYQGAPTDGAAWVTDGDKWRRMVRGGSWSDSPESLRSASRNAGTGDGRTYDHVGFRVARDVATGGSLF
jgi:formylglycine-generating enzyme required for sulfatase activity